MSVINIESLAPETPILCEDCDWIAKNYCTVAEFMESIKKQLVAFYEKGDETWKREDYECPRDYFAYREISVLEYDEELTDYSAHSLCNFLTGEDDIELDENDPDVQIAVEAINRALRKNYENYTVCDDIEYREWLDKVFYEYLGTLKEDGE